MDYVDISDQAKYRRGQLSTPQGLIIHHTAGGSTPSSIMNTLNQRGLGVQYVMDRDGVVYRTLPDGAKGAHMLPGSKFENSANRNLNNSNAIGIEIIAKNNKDLTPAQMKASQSFINDMQTKYPSIGNNIYGHGEVNPGHKEADEGMGPVSAYRAASGAPGTAPNQAAITKHLASYNPEASTPVAAAPAAPADPAKPAERPMLTEFSLPGKGSYALEDGMVVPKETGSPKAFASTPLVSQNQSIPGQAAGFNGANLGPSSTGFSGTSGSIVDQAKQMASTGQMGGLMGKLQTLASGGSDVAKSMMNALITPAYGATRDEVPKPLVPPVTPAATNPAPLVPTAPTTPVTPPTPNAAAAPADNPLIVRGIRPQEPVNPFTGLQPQTTPLPPTRPADSELFAQPTDQPKAQSQGTIFGANYHGPDSGMINVAMGAKPDFNSGIQSKQTFGDWLTPQQPAQPPAQQPIGQFDPLTGQSLQNNAGSGFMGFLGGLFG
ncbi:peptidoglycan recognition family protein [Methylobacterium sp. HMF5984]|uniref:peptidoglycan recognition protein family protein n=1 Tax=Methylobacterium sp. HMF5984 TaxID=3367370 RepID=UPI00385542A3